MSGNVMLWRFSVPMWDGFPSQLQASARQVLTFIYEYYHRTNHLKSGELPHTVRSRIRTRTTPSDAVGIDEVSVTSFAIQLTMCPGAVRLTTSRSTERLFRIYKYCTILSPRARAWASAHE